MKSNLSESCFRRSVSLGALVFLVACGGGDGDSAPVSDPVPAPSGAQPAQPAPAATPAAPMGATGEAGAVPPAPADAPIQVLLSGTQEVPPNGSAATGTGVITFDPDSGQFTVEATTQGMAGIAAHVHEGPVGVSGPIIFPMTETVPGSGVWRTSVQLTAAQTTALLAERYYINVHSAAFPNGEIRAQIPKE